MPVLVYVEHRDGEPEEPSRQAVTFARRLAGGEPVHGVAAGPGAAALAGALGALGVAALHVAEHEAYSTYAPAALGRAVADLAAGLSPGFVVGPGTERGNEVMAYAAAKANLGMAANCIEASSGDPARVLRVRWGGSLLEEAQLHGAVKLVTVQPHAVEAEETGAGPAQVEQFEPALSAAETTVRVVGRAEGAAGGMSLGEAKVVISAGRGAGSAEGFAPVEELAGLLGAAVGCSRAVTMAGWRPHTDQVGQTGTKIAPDLYIACGISGATQHMAGCKGAKRILAINSDPEAPIFSNADYAVVGDLHEVIPALSAEIRKARGA